METKCECKEDSRSMCKSCASMSTTQEPMKENKCECGKRVATPYSENVCSNYPNCSTQEPMELEEFVRDICSIVPKSKSEVKRRLIALIKQAEEKLVSEIKEKIEKKIRIHKQLETECIGTIEEIKSGRKIDNPHTFVIEQFEHLLSTY